MSEAVSLVSNIDLNEAFSQLQSAESGAVNIFIGTVRNQSMGKQVVKLEFEAYEPMALAEMKKLANKAAVKWQLKKVLLLHVTGTKEVGEAIVFIGVSSAHRDASFAACRFLINELKRTVPIWKKEYYHDNSMWVNAHP